MNISKKISSKKGALCIMSRNQDIIRIMLISIRNEEKIIQEELGIGYICSYLREKGLNVKIESYYSKKFMYEEVLEYNPNIIGFSVYDDSMYEAFTIANKIKNEMDCLIIFGGYAATYHPQEIMESCNSVDLVIKGEGEKTFYKIVQTYLKGYQYKECKGILYRKDGNIVETHGTECVENLDELPYPARDIFVKNKLLTAYISTSRGCTGMCKFCCSPKFFYKGWRGRSVYNVISEIRELYYKFGVRRIHFIDSSFEDPDINLKRCEELLDELIMLNLDIVYSADFRVNFYKKANDRIMKKIQKLCFSYVFLGIEAGNDQDLAIYGKGVTINEVKQSIKLFKKYDIGIDIGFICFNPYSTVDTLRKNIKFLHDYGLDSYMLNIRKLRIYRGTELYEQIQSDNLYIDDYTYKFVDNNIGKLFSYLEKLFSQNEEHVFLLNSQYYSVNYKHILAKLKFKGYVQEANELYEELNTLLIQISEHNYKWFIALIDVAEQGWDEEKAIEITYTLLDITMLIHAIKIFNIKQERIVKKYSKIRDILLS